MESLVTTATEIAKMNDIILDTDSYKASHYLQYPPGTQFISSYLEARSTKVFERSMFFGLQMYLKQIERLQTSDVDEAATFFEPHCGSFNRDGWNRLIVKHDGVLPLRIQAVPEGTVMPVGNVQFQVVNTDPEFPWLTSYMEAALHRVWYPSTVATVSWTLKQAIAAYLELTADDSVIPGVLPFRLHDFGARGASSKETAAIGGAAHLVNFLGTDTDIALKQVRRFYGEQMAGFSIPAAEHSTITSWGRNQETEAYANMVEKFSNGGAPAYAVVSDSYDFWRALDLWCGPLKQRVLDGRATLVVRPDSGDPIQVVPEALRRLAAGFGAEKNSKGYLVLNPKVRLVQGDGITLESAPLILQAIKDAGFSTENVVFGMGGGLLQKVDRDTLGYAMKCSAVKGANGRWEDVYKDPITDSAKRSKRGRLALVKRDGVYQTIREDQCPPAENLLVDVWRDGKLLKNYSFSEVRANAE